MNTNIRESQSEESNSFQPTHHECIINTILDSKKKPQTFHRNKKGERRIPVLVYVEVGGKADSLYRRKGAVRRGSVTTLGNEQSDAAVALGDVGNLGHMTSDATGGLDGAIRWMGGAKGDAAREGQDVATTRLDGEEQCDALENLGET